MLKEKVMKLEKMGAFFETRLGGYEEHMLTDIESAGEFYPFTASCLPDMPGANILDLGCGTGLEMDWYFRNNPSAKVTGIDLSKGMLATFKGKYADKDLNLICASYFDVPFGENIFDAAVSVQSLHHFTMEENVPLYTKLRKALKPDGFFILTDYFAGSDEEEYACRQELLHLKKEQNTAENDLFHYDTPLTLAHEIQALTDGGVPKVAVLKTWGATAILRAET